MTKIKFVCLLAYLIVWAQIASAGEKPWIEVKSPHFRVLTDAGVCAQHGWRTEADNYYLKLQSGIEPKKAFEESLGSFKEIDKALQEYSTGLPFRLVW